MKREVRPLAFNSSATCVSDAWMQQVAALLSSRILGLKVSTYELCGFCQIPERVSKGLTRNLPIIIKIEICQEDCAEQDLGSRHSRHCSCHCWSPSQYIRATNQRLTEMQMYCPGGAGSHGGRSSDNRYLRTIGCAGSQKKRDTYVSFASQCLDIAQGQHLLANTNHEICRLSPSLGNCTADPYKVLKGIIRP